MPAENPVYDAKHPVVQAYLARGYAVAGWSSPVFWPLEQSFPNQMTVLDEFARLVGKPERTIAYGQSIGGFLTAGLAQTFPKRLDGALAICGPLAGGVATQNRELDLAFVFKTLIAPDSDLDLVRIRQPERNQALSLELLELAATTPQGRARLALAAGVTNVPGWPDPRSAEPATGDYAARLDGQIGWFRGIVFHVIFNARATIERRAGGNPSWNTLVRIPTVNPPGERYADCAALIGATLVRLGYDVREVRPRSDPDPAHPRLNVVGRLSGAKARPLLHFNGHFDVVPTGDTGDWTRDPFGAEHADGRIWGRGTGDQKAGIAASIFAVEAIRRAGLRLGGTVEQSATVDEESGGFAGMAELCAQGICTAADTDHVVITEPLDVDRVCLGHRGVLWTGR